MHGYSNVLKVEQQPEVKAVIGVSTIEVSFFSLADSLVESIFLVWTVGLVVSIKNYLGSVNV